MGVSRDAFYRYKEAVESDGVEALIEKSRRKPNPKNRIDAAAKLYTTKTSITSADLLDERYLRMLPQYRPR